MRKKGMLKFLDKSVINKIECKLEKLLLKRQQLEGLS